MMNFKLSSKGLIEPNAKNTILLLYRKINVNLNLSNEYGFHKLPLHYYYDSTMGGSMLDGGGLVMTNVLGGKFASAVVRGTCFNVTARIGTVSGESGVAVQPGIGQANGLIGCSVLIFCCELKTNTFNSNISITKSHCCHQYYQGFRFLLYQIHNLRKSTKLNTSIHTRNTFLFLKLPVRNGRWNMLGAGGKILVLG
ncbi:hypothetical protein AGLY_006983 [Aphis glycines]|uniref:Uncharacterized protein n=1 Tax=Aphis glycines TaxID=307491 RepID=A0A6G0TPR6_APHGL|nr:hypothetical protein AGLY_006983 [Aphis glycines]